MTPIQAAGQLYKINEITEMTSPSFQVQTKKGTLLTYLSILYGNKKTSIIFFVNNREEKHIVVSLKLLP
jgi:hypothetical protein